MTPTVVRPGTRGTIAALRNLSTCDDCGPLAGTPTDQGAAQTPPGNTRIRHFQHVTRNLNPRILIARGGNAAQPIREYRLLEGAKGLYGSGMLSSLPLEPLLGPYFAVSMVFEGTEDN
jgi:hypothetical protein